MFMSRQLILINRIKNKANRFFNFVSLILLKNNNQYRVLRIEYRVQNISYPVTRFTSWPVIRYKIQDKTVG